MATNTSAAASPASTNPTVSTPIAPTKPGAVHSGTPRYDGYLVTIGIECHVQFNTKTKLFAAVGNDARDAEPNTLVSHICFGLPGALPVLNEQAVERAIKAAFALNTEPQLFSKFDRKHYFYPDLPLGYQITQYDQPIILGGHIDIIVDGTTKRVGITRAHLESDAGKSLHPTGKDYSLVDLNRAGTPLLEIVSEPDMHTPAEAKAYARELYLRVKYAGISDADLFHGNMRFDVNVSVSKDPHVLGTRTESKNLNSFRSVEKAVEYEIKRQIDQLEHGHKIIQETRGWDDAKQKTFSQRSKENAEDYRYFPDPDLPPIIIDPKTVAVIKNDMPELPDTLRARFADLGLDFSQIEMLIDEPEAAIFLRSLIDAYDAKTAKTIANWVTGEIQRYIIEGDVQWATVISKESQLTKLVAMVDAGSLSSTAAKEVLAEIMQSNEDPEAIAKAKNLIQENDESALIMIVEEVLSANPQAAQDVQNGETKAIGFLVGMVMKASQGKANPKVVQQLLRKQLGI